jgi:RNA polymerase sigma factor (TIGR02999 family)
MGLDKISPQVTQLLGQWGEGDRKALDELIPLVYDELRGMAHRHMARERPNHTLQATALVNEVYLKLQKDRGVQWRNRAHFFAVAAQMMRHILVDYAREHTRAKRGGGAEQVPLEEGMLVSKDNADNVLAVDEALQKLEQFDPRKAEVAVLHIFAGLSAEETAEALKISVMTVRRDWRTARAWLRTHLDKAA